MSEFEGSNFNLYISKKRAEVFKAKGLHTKDDLENYLCELYPKGDNQNKGITPGGNEVITECPHGYWGKEKEGFTKECDSILRLIEAKDEILDEPETTLMRFLKTTCCPVCRRRKRADLRDKKEAARPKEIIRKYCPECRKERRTRYQKLNDGSSVEVCVECSTRIGVIET